MSKGLAFAVLLGVAALLAATDFFMNSYGNIQEGDFVLEQEVEENFVLKSHLPETFISELPDDVKVQEAIPATTLFTRLIVSELDIQEAAQTALMKGIKKFGVIYEFSGGESIYFQLRSGLELILEKDDSIFDADNLGEYSMYYNDAKRPDTVFLLALIQGRIWGFEYPREYHEEYKKLTQVLLP